MTAFGKYKNLHICTCVIHKYLYVYRFLIAALLVSPYRTVLIRLLKFIVLISLSAQFVACIWYVLGCQAGTCKSGTWAEGAGESILYVLWAFLLIYA